MNKLINWILISAFIVLAFFSLASNAVAWGPLPAVISTGNAPCDPIGNDDNTVLLIHSNNINGSQIFTDTASGTTEVGGKTLTANGHVQHNTNFYKFAISGVSFDGTSDCISTPTHSAWEFGTGDFGIGLWLRLTVDRDTMLISNHSGTPANNNWVFQYYKTSGILRFTKYPGGTVSLGAAWAPTLNTWYHVEVNRNGNNLYFFINGTQIAPTGNVTGWNLNATTSLAVGTGADGSTQALSGNMDEIIVKKGVALHITNFTPPILPYCD